MTLVAGLLIAIVAVLLVLEPVLRAATGRRVDLAVPLFADSDDEDDPVLRRRDTALAALREIEFDRATGKLSDPDYDRLHARYQVEALDALRAVDAAAAGRGVVGSAGRDDASTPRPPGPSSADPIEALIADAKAKAGARRQRFCSECGDPLEGSGRFCVACGSAVGAGAG